VQMKLWQYAVLAYALLYFVRAGSMEAENLNQSYPAAYVAFSMIAQICVVCGIILFAIEARAEFANVWRLLFPLLVLELALGILFDVTYQSDLNNLWMNELFGLWLAAPRIISTSGSLAIEVDRRSSPQSSFGA
jgi:hypothetical protein